FPLGRRYLRLRAVDERDASDVEVLRELSYHPSSDVHVHVFSGSRNDARAGKGGVRTPLVWSMPQRWTYVRVNLLDVARMAPAGVGALRWPARRRTTGAV